jgi:hypothetical protein
MTERRRKPILPNVVLVAVVLGLVYLLSYAPVANLELARREKYGWPDPPPNELQFQAGPLDSYELPLYSPVDWLIDNTPLRSPLFWWAAVWGARDDFEYRHASRMEETAREREARQQENAPDPVHEVH